MASPSDLTDHGLTHGPSGRSPVGAADLIPDAQELGVGLVVHESHLPSTMDLAHALAADGAPAGVLVIADRQDAGRGRGGHRWESADGDGVLLTLLERPQDARAIGVLSLRAGLAVANALEGLVDEPVTLKWPNDVFAGAGKLAGILVEARWHDSRVEWVAIGVGINRRVPDTMPGASALKAGVTRAQVLRALVPRLRDAARSTDVLTDAECAAWHARDRVRGRRLRAPISGRAMGISADGALLVQQDEDGRLERVHAGSLEFDD